ncbi:hypothetical protein PR048_029044 [Dryococelus australis]|uniref:Uncharacterized protein n=1 Tax=Dryococelus australis TaxID=614101 RepID=A0ABQ9GCN8_9NEOP|nr:hypothetical protein PR048_029044 [Dryococelus australis]
MHLVCGAATQLPYPHKKRDTIRKHSTTLVLNVCLRTVKWRLESDVDLIPHAFRFLPTSVTKIAKVFKVPPPLPFTLAISWKASISFRGERILPGAAADEQVTSARVCGGLWGVARGPFYNGSLQAQAMAVKLRLRCATGANQNGFDTHVWWGEKSRLSYARTVGDCHRSSQLRDLVRRRPGYLVQGARLGFRKVGSIREWTVLYLRLWKVNRTESSQCNNINPASSMSHSCWPELFETGSWSPKSWGATDRLPPRRTGFNPRPGRSRVFASGYRAGRCRWSAGFLRDIPFPQPLQSGAVNSLNSTHLTPSLNSTFLCTLRELFH